jgi:hypothetical protein
MSYRTVESLREKIIAILPAYEENGDITRLLLEDGSSSRDDRTVQTVKKVLARCYLLDLKEQARQLQASLQRRKLLPFYLNHERIFIPIKMRAARIKNDCCYGYLDWRCIADLEQHADGGTLVRMRNGLQESALSSTSHIIQQLHTGRQLYEALQQQAGRTHSSEQLLLEAARLLAGSLDLLHNGLGKLGKNGQGKNI